MAETNANFLNPDKVIVFQCQADTSRASYLNGKTGDGTVDMAYNTDQGFSGTHWQVQIIEQIDGNSAFATIKCLGNIDGPRYLDGRTADATVGLAPETGGIFTGTRWLIRDFGNYILTLECQGNVPGNRYLDGRTGNATVGLAPETGGIFTGTKWKFSYL